MKISVAVVLASVATTFLFVACGEKEDEDEAEDAEAMVSCLVAAEACFDFTTTESATEAIETSCEAGTILNDDGTAGTYSDDVCADIPVGTTACEDYPTKHGGTGTIWWLGLAEGQDMTSWCTDTANGTATTKS